MHKSFPRKDFKEFYAAPSLFGWKVMRALYYFEPVSFLPVKIFVRSVFVLDQVPKHDEELNSGVVLRSDLNGFLNKLDEFGMIYFEKLSDEDALNSVSCLETRLLEAKKV